MYYEKYIDQLQSRAWSHSLPKATFVIYTNGVFLIDASPIDIDILRSALKES